jgi:hypothetical protein
MLGETTITGIEVGVARSPLKAGEKLECRVESQLQDMANDTALVRSFFRHPSVRCVSDY